MHEYNTFEEHLYHIPIFKTNYHQGIQLDTNNPNLILVQTLILSEVVLSILFQTSWRRHDFWDFVDIFIHYTVYY